MVFLVRDEIVCIRLLATKKDEKLPNWGCTFQVETGRVSDTLVDGCETEIKCTPKVSPSFYI